MARRYRFLGGFGRALRLSRFFFLPFDELVAASTIALPSCARSSFLPFRCVFNHVDTGTLQNPLPISK